MSMVVRCAVGSLRDLPDAFAYEGYRERFLPLTPGRDYPVYAVTSFKGGLWYYILDDDGLGEPIWYPSPIFEIVDGRVPDHWRLGQHAVGDAFRAILSFPEWSEDPHFYERLYDGDQIAVEAFRREVERRGVGQASDRHDPGPGVEPSPA